MRWIFMRWRVSFLSFLFFPTVTGVCLIIRCSGCDEKIKKKKEKTNSIFPSDCAPERWGERSACGSMRAGAPTIALFAKNGGSFRVLLGSNHTSKHPSSSLGEKGGCVLFFYNYHERRFSFVE